jgi:DNA repair photolyase
LVSVGERRCKTILGRSGIGSVDYAVNPYLGCEHGCVYCYARFMSRMGHAGEEWGSFVDIKVNALERLQVETRRKRKGVVLLSSVTDPYQPLERRFELTRGSLRILLEYQFPVVVQTKSDLVLRDLDLLKQFDDCEVGFTITTIDEAVRRVFEPRSAPVQARLAALRKLSEAGVETYAFLGPLLPYLSEEGLGELLDELSESIGHVIVDRLNIKCGNLSPIRRALSRHYPDLQPMFESALPPDSGYYDRLKREVAAMCRERAIPFDFCY